MGLWLGFVLVAAVDIVTPGPAIVLAVHNGAVVGPRRTLWSTLGNELGLLGHGLIGALGIGAVLGSSAGLLIVMQTIGAVYLTYLGVTKLRSARDPLTTEVGQIDGEPTALFRSGFATAALNPRPFLFFAALLPQFINPARSFGVQVTAMIATFLVLSFASLSGYALLGSRVGSLRRGDQIRRGLMRISGLAFLFFAAHLMGIV